MSMLNFATELAIVVLEVIYKYHFCGSAGCTDALHY